MLDLSNFRNRLVSANLLAGWASFAAIGGVFLLLPFYLENVLGHPPIETGLLLASAPLALGLSAPVAGAFSDRVGPWPVILLGLSILLTSYLLMTTLGTRTSALGYLLVMAPVGLGMGTFQSPNNSAVMGAVPAVAQVAALRETMIVSAGLVGVALAAALWGRLRRGVHIPPDRIE